MTTIKQNVCIKKVKKDLVQGQQKITRFLDSNGQESTDKDEILKIIQGLYEQLYDSDIQTEEPESSNELTPNVTDWEVKHAVNHMARGKATGPDNILIDTIKDGNDIINKELVRLSSACLQMGKVSQQWREVNMIILHKKGDKQT